MPGLIIMPSGVTFLCQIVRKEMMKKEMHLFRASLLA